MNNHKNARTLAEGHNFIPTYSCVLTSNKINKKSQLFTQCQTPFIFFGKTEMRGRLEISTIVL